MNKKAEINSFDREMLEMTISLAEKAYEKGNYPVGAVITIDGKVVGSQENSIVTKKTWVHHAENQLIVDNGELIRKSIEEDREIVLYSSLEPCLMCLGTATMNKISKIIYIHKDPHGGACDLKIDGLGECYPRIFPKIIEARISEKPKELIVKFIENQLEIGNTSWAIRVLPLFKKS